MAAFNSQNTEINWGSNFNQEEPNSEFPSSFQSTNEAFGDNYSVSSATTCEDLEFRPTSELFWERNFYPSPVTKESTIMQQQAQQFSNFSGFLNPSTNDGHYQIGVPNDFGEFPKNDSNLDQYYQYTSTAQDSFQNCVEKSENDQLIFPLQEDFLNPNKAANFSAHIQNSYPPLFSLPPLYPDSTGSSSQSDLSNPYFGTLASSQSIPSYPSMANQMFSSLSPDLVLTERERLLLVTQERHFMQQQQQQQTLPHLNQNIHQQQTLSMQNPNPSFGRFDSSSLANGSANSRFIQPPPPPPNMSSTLPQQQSLNSPLTRLASLHRTQMGLPSLQPPTSSRTPHPVSTSLVNQRMNNQLGIVLPEPSSLLPSAPPMTLNRTNVMPAMNEIIFKVQFKRKFRYFVLGSSAQRDITLGDFVKVEADRGEDLGIVHSIMTAQAYMDFRYHQSLNPSPVKEEEGSGDIKHIIRLASTYEKKQLPIKMQEEQGVIQSCRDLAIGVYSLPLIIVDVEYQYDRHKLIVYYESNRRVDFREFVRDLFALYKARIWMQQIDPQFLPDETISSALGSGTLVLPTSAHLSVPQNLQQPMPQQAQDPFKFQQKPPPPQFSSDLRLPIHSSLPRSTLDSLYNQSSFSSSSTTPSSLFPSQPSTAFPSSANQSLLSSSLRVLPPPPLPPSPPPSQHT